METQLGKTIETAPLPTEHTAASVLTNHLIVTTHPQLHTSFPNQNSKHIDYVLTYKYNLHSSQAEFNKNDLVRKSFIDRLRSEGLEVEFLRYKEKNNVTVFVLLHCPVERLLIEAERLKFQIPIKQVCTDLIFCLIIFQFD
jgi:hypothetical protein